MSLITLRKIAYARSGDKGSSANIGLIAYTQKGYTFLCNYLTAERIAAYFKPLEPTSTIRYELPNLMALNFVLKDVLAGGGSRSLRTDSQGKVLAQALLEMPLDLDPQLLAQCQRSI